MSPLVNIWFKSYANLWVEAKVSHHLPMFCGLWVFNISSDLTKSRLWDQVTF